MTTPRTATLSDWLLEQIAADEAAARAAATYSEHWTVTDEFNETVLLNESDQFGHTFDSVYGEVAPHIARHDPAHVLAVSAAHRRIVEQLQHIDAGVLIIGDGEAARREYRSGVLFALRALASAYADRPGWREEWR